MPPLLGAQEPTFKWACPWVYSWGPDAVAIWERASGKKMDPYQANYLNDALGLDDDDLYAHDRGAMIVGRQNGKGDIIEARELAGLAILDERMILHSAHEFKTAREAFFRMLALIENSPDLDRRVIQVTRAKGEEGIKFRGTRRGIVNRLVYVARSQGSGRGFTGHVNIMDEAMILDGDALSALMPTMSAIRNPQILYFGSAGARTMRSGSEVLSRVRRSALRQDPGIVAYFWEGAGSRGSTTWAVDRTLPETWARLNPAYGRRITKRSCRREISDMTPEDFDRERLGVGDWPSEEGWKLMNQDHWTSRSGLYDPESHASFPVAIGIDMPPGLECASVVVSSRQMDNPELIHMERIPATLYVGYEWVVPFLVDLCSRREVGLIVMDPRSPANVILEDLKKAKPKTVAREIREATGSEVCTWSAQWLVAATRTCVIRHIGQKSMERAVGGAVKMDVGDGLWKWSRRKSDVDISPLYAMTFAWGALQIGWKKRRAVLAGAERTSQPRASEEQFDPWDE